MDIDSKTKFMKIISDFPSIRIEDFKTKNPRTFKASDLQKAESLGLDTVQDVLADQHQGSCKSMKAKLRSYPDGIINIHNYFYCTPLLPSACSDTTSLAEDIKSFIADLDVLLDRFRAMPFEFDTASKSQKMESLLTAVKYRYLHGLDDAAVALHCKITKESSRLYHTLFIKKVREAMLMQRTSAENQFVLEFGFNECFKRKLQNLKDSFKPGSTLASMQELLGTRNGGNVSFVLDLLDASIFTGSGSAFVGSYVVAGIGTTGFDQDCMTIFNIMNDRHAPCADFIKELSKRLGDKDKVDTIVTMMQTSGQFAVTEEYGIKSYQLMWQWLKNDDVRYERILFENKGRSMSIAELLAEYNRRAAMVRLRKRDEFHLSQNDRIVAQNGMWHWVADDENVDIYKDPRPFIESYVVGKGGSVTLDDVIAFLESKGIHLTRNTVRAYLTKFCKSRRGSDIFTMLAPSAVNQRGDIAPDIIDFIKSQENQVCVSDIAKALDTSCGRIDRLVDAHPELFIKDSSPARKKIYVTLKPGYDSKPVVVKEIKKVKEAKHITFIRMTAVDILSKAEGHSLPMKDVFDKVIVGIEGLGISPNIIYKVFDNEIFIKTEIPGKREKNLCLNLPLYDSLYKKEAKYAETPKSETDVTKAFDWDTDYEDLKAAVVSYVKDNPYTRTFDVANAFDVMNDIMKGNRGSLNRDSYFWLIQELLYKYLMQKTTKIEREFLRDNLAYKYEPFLDHYYTMVTGRSLGVKGLVSTLETLQDEGLLPERYSDWSSSYTSDLIYKRNRVHTAKRDMDSTIKNDILQFLVLYLYTASKSDLEA